MKHLPVSHNPKVIYSVVSCQEPAKQKRVGKAQTLYICEPCHSHCTAFRAVILHTSHAPCHHHTTPPSGLVTIRIPCSASFSTDKSGRRKVAAVYLSMSLTIQTTLVSEKKIESTYKLSAQMAQSQQMMAEWWQNGGQQKHVGRV